ncbi:adenylosuccinate synthase [Halorubrum ezzemoulense]|uniref:Adenylosuccinate synthetase n=1 Tax=Halorubrum ezzemoulense TaxID=337243 RepID=A0A256K6T5_HALEZ|nr:adenylosuccinate synthase [Halorubrum ezzemoulense]OYR76771.1 adenylosuccinate synthase [Halorubrum ezzemoulense]QAY19860.1 adenylosuccinate synthase [Halorubrum ezzemoulense]
MTLTIVGSQLGDEGKGALVDRWGGDADVVVRYQGGDNAGHTVVEGGAEYKLSLVPSGAVRGTVGILGNGCVVNPKTLFAEIDNLREQGLDPDVRVARRAHVIMPYHRVLDGIEEEVKADDDAGDAVGTTGRGIGPTYEDKAGRRGIRVADLLDPETLREKLEYAVPQKRALVEDVYGLDLDSEAQRASGSRTQSGDDDSDDDRAAAFDVDALHEEFAAIGERLADEGMTVNCSDYLHRRHEAGDEILFEGAQGTHIDVDHGNYPFVTSSNPTAGGAAVGSGLGVTTVGDGEVVGIVKAYLSRVGEGPLPTELDGDADEEALADEIREKGGEFGTVTGRPRRIGWLDLPMLRHAARVSGFTGVAVNHVDVLAGLDELKVCTGYELDGETLDTVPTTTDRWERCEPVYEMLDTWAPFDSSAVAEAGYDALPEAARDYLEFVADEIDTPVYAVGVGPDREETVELTNPFDE